MVTASGTFSEPLEKMRDYLASLSLVQTFLGVGSSALAKAKIYPIGNVYEDIELPQAGVAFSNRKYKIATGGYVTYDLEIWFADKLSDDYTTTADQMFNFMNKLGPIETLIIQPTDNTIQTPYITEMDVDGPFTLAARGSNKDSIIKADYLCKVGV